MSLASINDWAMQIRMFSLFNFVFSQVQTAEQFESIDGFPTKSVFGIHCYFEPAQVSVQFTMAREDPCPYTNIGFAELNAF